MVGIGRRMPFTMAAFFVGSLSVIGLPPAGGLISKLFMVQGALQADLLWVLVIYLISSLLNAAYFFPIVYKAFFCTEAEAQFQGPMKEAPLCAMLPPVITAVVSVVLFFWPGIFLGFVNVFLAA